MAKEIPDGLRLLLYEEADFQCGHCGHREGLNLTIHHIVFREDGGSTEYGNLIVLCHNCHARIHNTGTISSKDIRRIKRHLVQRFFTRPGVNSMKLAYKHPEGLTVAPPVFVEHMVGLGYLEFIQSEWDIVIIGASEPIVQRGQYRLTEAGKAITEKWLLRDDD